jgi:hypothetical protein
MSALAIAILLVSTATYSTEPDAVFTTATACSIEPDALFPADAVDSTAVDSTAAPAPTVDPQPRSLLLSAESRVLREDAHEQSASVLVTERFAAPSTRRRFRLEAPGRAWPFALAASADAATTYWALAHGGSERNPLLAFLRLDVGMVKIVQFPLLAKAIDTVEARHPRLGRRLRWATLAFHAVLAVNNVRMGRTAGELGLGARRLAKP